MITFLTTFKPFKFPFDKIQMNALKSWLRFCPPCEIVIVGAEEGVEKVVAHIPYVRVIPNVRRSEFGAPLLDDLIRTGESVANNELMCLINGDIIIADDILRIVKIIKKKFDSKFLLTCRRYDIEIPDLINNNLHEDIEFLRNQTMTLYSKLKKRPRGADLFVYGKGLFEEIPPFAIGRLVWSRWLIYKALSKGMPVIDATEALTVLHQRHTFTHINEPLVRRELSKGKSGYDAVVLSQDYKRNVLLGGVAAYFSEDDCNYILTKNMMLRRRTDIQFVLRRLFTTSLLNPRTSRCTLAIIRVLMPAKTMRLALKKGLFKARILY